MTAHRNVVIVAGVGFALLLTVAALVQRRSQSPDTPGLAKSDAEKRILSVLQQVRNQGEVYLEVPVADGKMLRLLVEAADAKHVVEIGTSTGYSALWICLALQNTGGKLTSFEIDPGRAAQARQHFQRAGVDTIANVVVGDAHDSVRRLKGPIDVVFMDADKEGYLDYLNRTLPLVRPGGLILAHNFQMAPDYVKAVTNDPNLETVFYTQGGGLAVTLKKR